MLQNVTRNDCLAEIKRFFKYYSHFCQSPDPDSVREVLASAYSVNDKVRKAGFPDFFDSDEFLAIKAIRNYAIHQAEIYNKTRALPLVSTIPIDAELRILCLVPMSIATKILEGSTIKITEAINRTCIFYRDYVDIYPSLFNFGVQLFLYTEKNNLEVNSGEYDDIANSIRYERENNYPHYVSGGIRLPQGHDIDEFLERSLYAMNEHIVLQKAMYSEKDGMFTLR